MAGIGEKLREARASKGLTLDQAEEATKVRSKYLAALEDEEFDVIPGKAYVKGFLKIYASYLGLDSEEMLSNYSGGGTSQDKPRDSEPAEKGNKDEKAPIKAPSSFKSREPRKYQGPNKYIRRRTESKWQKYLLTGILALAAVGTLVFFNFNWNKSEAPENKDIAEIEQQDNPSNENQAGEPSQPQGGNNQPPDENAVPPGGNEVPPGGNNPPAAEENQLDNIEGVKVVLKTKEQDCWVKVVVDGQTTFTGNMAPGEEKSFDGKEEIRLVLGNAGAVDVTYNGQALGSLGPIGKVIKKEFTKSL